MASKPTLHQKTELIATVPVIGQLTTSTILAETGDITRFTNPDQLGAYPVLAPRINQSGRTVHHGYISKQAPRVLRWVLQKAVWAAISTTMRLRSYDI